MVIHSTSRRLVLLSRLSRLLPPGLSGVFLRFYHPEIARQEGARFIARSSLADVVLSFPRPDWVANSFAIRGFYNWANVVIANSVCREGDTLIEVGANIGTETMHFGRIVGPRGRVVAFEPIPGNFELLKLQLQFNHLPQVEAHQAAVSDRSGSIRFVPPVTDLNAGVGRMAHGSDQDDETIEVQTFVLDEMFADRAFCAPKLLVMDVQGAEHHVLSGAARILSECRPCVVAEMDPELLEEQSASVAQIYELLKKHDYQCWRVNKWGLKPADPNQKDESDWFCAPNGGADSAGSIARRVSRKLGWAAAMPLIRGLNPAIVARNSS